MFFPCVSPRDCKRHENWIVVPFIYHHIPGTEHRYLTQGRCLRNIHGRDEWSNEWLLWGHTLVCPGWRVRVKLLNQEKDFLRILPIWDPLISSTSSSISIERVKQRSSFSKSKSETNKHKEKNIFQNNWGRLYVSWGPFEFTKYTLSTESVSNIPKDAVTYTTASLLNWHLFHHYFMLLTFSHHLNDILYLEKHVVPE